MRNKITFKIGRSIRTKPHDVAVWVGQFADKSDSELPTLLAEILQEERAAVAARDLLPPYRDVRHTLEKLGKLDDAQFQAAVQVVDGRTKAYLLTGLSALCKRQEVPYPDNGGLRHIASQLAPLRQEIIRLAIQSVSKKDGRPTKIEQNKFAARLAEYWLNATGKMPTVSPGKNEFVTFARKQFGEVGGEYKHKATSNEALLRTLRLGVQRFKRSRK